VANRDVLAVGTSAGGVQTLLFLNKHFAAISGVSYPTLRPDFPAAVLVKLHLPMHARSEFGGVLKRAGPLIRRVDQPAADAAWRANAADE